MTQAQLPMEPDAALWQARAEALLPIVELAWEVWRSHKGLHLSEKVYGRNARVSDKALQKLGDFLEDYKAKAEAEAVVREL